MRYCILQSCHYGQSITAGTVRPLGTILLQFNSWLQQNFGDFVFNSISDKNCAVVTWTDWDLKVCLEYECKRKNLRVPVCLQSWIDLKYVYKKFYNRQPQGLSGALTEMGLKFEGREHSGKQTAVNFKKR